MSESKNRKKGKVHDGSKQKKICKVQNIKYTIEILNYQCLEEIFSYLCTADRLNLEKLSKKLKDASSFAWRRVTDLTMKIHSHSSNEISRIKKHSIEDFQYKVIAEQVLNRCGNYLKTLNLRYRYDSLMQLVSNKCRNLRELTFEFNIYRTQNFNDVFENMINLKYIEIRNYVFPDMKILESLPKHIEEISLKHYYSERALVVTRDSENFAKEWKTLQSLSLRGLYINDDVDIIFHANYPLTHLNLERCRFTDIGKTRLAILKYENLERLNLSRSKLVDDNFLNAITNNFKYLKYLNIDGCQGISKRPIAELGKLKNLEEIYLHGIGIDNVVLANFNNLKILYCTWSSEVSDTGVIAILDNSPNLERLCLLFTSITANALSHAANLTNRRQKKLVIHTDTNVIISFNQRNEISSFLELKDTF